MLDDFINQISTAACVLTTFWDISKCNYNKYTKALLLSIGQNDQEKAIVLDKSMIIRSYICL